MKGLEGRRPDNLGIDSEGRLAPSPNTPNCVHSQRGRGRNAIKPLRYEGDSRGAMRRLHEVLIATRGAHEIRASGGYLYFEFHSRLFGFVDDVEFACDRRASVIHVRSASRLGHSDLGANRRRVEAIRRTFAAVNQRAKAPSP